MILLLLTLLLLLLLHFLLLPLQLRLSRYLDIVDDNDVVVDDNDVGVVVVVVVGESCVHGASL